MTGEARFRRTMSIRKAQSKRLHARAEQTRQDLLNAALQLFSARGFEGVSTRELATAAGTTMSSIPYHFGSKEGLYRTVLEHMDARMREHLAPVLQTTQQLLARRSITRQQKLDALAELVSAHARTILNSNPEWIAFVMHEQLRPAELAEPRFDVTAIETILTAMRLVAALRQQPMKHPEVRLQTIMLFGRAAVLSTFRAGTYVLMERHDLTPAHVERVAKLIRAEIQVIFA